MRVRPALADALERFAESDDVSAYTLILDAFAALALQQGDRQRAARLSGGVAELETRSGTSASAYAESAASSIPAPSAQASAK